jgi:hypothetical protein
VRTELVEAHELLMEWSEWLSKYSIQRGLPLKQIYGGGVLANKRSAVFKIPRNIQKIDLCVAAVTRSFPRLSHVLYEGYLGEGPWPEKAERLALTTNTMTLHMRYARTAVTACYKLMNSRDLLSRTLDLLA